jgi:steroid delta-isomerase
VAFDEEIPMNEDHPAMKVARASWAAVRSHDKQAWLDLMADDVCIEDPIGSGPTNPTGHGIRGKAEVSAFYDKHIANSKIVIVTHESHSVGNEAAHVMELTTTLQNGVVTKLRSIFSYRVNDAGKLTSMRGYWTLDDMEFTKAS